MFPSLRKWSLCLLLTAGIFISQLSQAAASVRQEKNTAWTAAAATSVNAVFTSAALTGDTIETWVICSCSTAPSSVTDSASQTYTLRTSKSDNNSGVTIYLYTSSNNTSATTLTVTATWSVAQTYNGIWIKELTGVSSAPYQASGGLNQCASGCTSTAGTTTGAITSGNVTPTSQPALVSSLSWDDGGGASSVVAGSLVSGTTGWLLAGGGGAATTTSGSQRVTSTAAFASTFTNTTDGGTRFFVTMESIYTEAAATNPPSRGFFIN